MQTPPEFNPLDIPVAKPVDDPAQESKRVKHAKAMHFEQARSIARNYDTIVGYFWGSMLVLFGMAVNFFTAIAKANSDSGVLFICTGILIVALHSATNRILAALYAQRSKPE